MFVGLSGFVGLPVQAADTSYFVGYRGEYSSNVERVAVGEQHEFINSLLAGFRYADSSPALEVRVAPSLEYLHYSQGTNDNETRLTLDAYALWAISPQRFTWTLEDNVRQVRADPTQTDTPSNTVASNVFTTGPDFYLRFGRVSTLQLGGRFEIVDVEDSVQDNQRRLGYTRWLYQTSPQTRLSANYEVSAIVYKDETVTPNYTRQDYFGRFESQQARSTFDLDLGTTKISRVGRTEEEAPLWRLAWTHLINTGSRFGIAAESSYGDTGTDLRDSAVAANAPPGETTITNSQNLVVPDIFYAKRGTVFYQRLDSLLVTDLRLDASRLEFDAVPEDDREEEGGVAVLTYLYSGATSFGVFGNRKRARYLNVAQVDTETNYGLSVTYRIRQVFSMTLGVSRSERESTDPARSFEDQRIFATLLYSSGTSRRQ